MMMTGRRISTCKLHLGVHFVVAIALTSAFRSAQNVMVVPAASPWSRSTTATRHQFTTLHRSTTDLSYSQTTNTIEITESAPRDIAPLFGWAASYGVQASDCFDLARSETDDNDVYAMTTCDLPANSPILYVPASLIFTSSGARREIFEAITYDETALDKAEGTLLPSDHKYFRLFLKVLLEYEKGESSPWHGYLNSLPRYFSNGASMTDFCFNCLPPYAALEAADEKARMKRFLLALNDVLFLSVESRADSYLTKWAYGVVRTRCTEVSAWDCALVPMVDMLNHGGDNAFSVDGGRGANACLSYDEHGNCYVYSTRDLYAGEAIRISYGDSTNPSRLLARYGFLDESSSATYCKYIIDEPTSEHHKLGYPDRMLFFNDGGISDEVWDVILYVELEKMGLDEQKKSFYDAHVAGDEMTKSALHGVHFPITLEALHSHTDDILNELEELGVWQMTKKDSDRHPRLPLIMAHNEFVKRTFELVKQNLQLYH